ncbi:MAG: alpha/beta fold hydrolase [Lachnospiraceae bacterium]|nr:alpha/beta fold hydrolase [Lachnospiraceae bacterium]
MKRSKTAALLAAVLCAVLLAACAGPAEPTQAPTQPAATQAPTQPAATQVPTQTPTQPRPTQAPTQPAPTQPAVSGGNAVLTDGKVPDSHQGSSEKDASWKRYDLYAKARPGTDVDKELAPFFAINNFANWNTPTNGGVSLDGYTGIGGFRSGNGAQLTFTFTSSEDAEVGLYGQFAYRSTAQTYDKFGTITVNGAEVACAVAMPETPEGGTEYATSNTYTFLAYISVKKGQNTVILQRGSDSNGSYNFWGIRLTARTAVITAEGSPAPAGPGTDPTGPTPTQSAPTQPAPTQPAQEASYIEQRFETKNGENTIRGMLYIPKNATGKIPTVILSHGYNTTWDNVPINYAKPLAEAGFLCVLFDYCGGCTRSSSDGKTTEMSIFTEEADLRAVFEYTKKLEQADTSQIYLLGISQGGVITSMLAAELKEQIKAMVLCFPAYSLKEDAVKTFGTLDKVPAEYNLMNMKIGHVFYEKLFDWDYTKLFAPYTGNVLILHGTADTLVPISFSETAVQQYAHAQLIKIEGAGHGFRNQYLEQANTYIGNFLKTGSPSGTNP